MDAAFLQQDDEQQPFFRARIYLLPRASDEVPQATTSNPLLTLNLALQSRFDAFLKDPLPTGAEGYIFNRSTPTFKAASHASPPHILVECQTGSSTEDAHILLHFLVLQQRDQHSILANTAIQITTEDGDLLLIEAADVLPDWVNPDNADGRVWIVDEQVSLIPPDVDAGNATQHSKVGPITDYTRALTLIAEKQVTPSSEITEAAFAPLSSYPETSWVEAVQHRTTAYLPSSAIATTFARHPQLISRASRAFMGRQGAEIRIASRMAHFLPTAADPPAPNPSSSSSSPLVPIPIPRRIYAQLLSQRFMPPKIFPPPFRKQVEAFWDAIDSSAPRSSDAIQEGRRWDLGCKLAVGLEIAYDNDTDRLKNITRGQSNIHRQAHSTDQDPRSSAEYEPFIQRLTSLGFFQGELRDSAKWQELETRAVQDWSHQQTTGGDVLDANEEESELSWVQDVNSGASSDVTAIDPKNTASLKAIELDDSWLWDVDESLLESIDHGATSQNESAEKEATQRLTDFSKRIESFISGKGDVEGAVIDANDDDSDADDDNDDDEDDDEGSDDAKEEAKRRFNALTPEEKREQMKSLIQGVHGSTETDTWGRGTINPNQADDMALDERTLAEAIDRDDQMPATQGSASDATDKVTAPTATPASPQQNTTAAASGGKSLSPSQMRSQMDSYRRTGSTKHKPMMSTSFFSSQQFDGAESWQLDSEPEDSEEEELARKKEPKEVRRERARLLELSESESEDEEEDEAALAEQDEKEEMDDFLQFARKELGFSEQQLSSLLQERKSQGRWIPGQDDGETVATEQRGKQNTPKAAAAAAPAASVFGKGFSKGFLGKQRQPLTSEAIKQAASQQAAVPQATASKSTTGAAPLTTQTKRKVAFVEDDDVDKRGQGNLPSGGQRLGTTATPAAVSSGSSLNSFDTLMSALDSKLDEHRASKGLPPLDRNEYYGKGEIRGEDWALRREGGASLGSVLKKRKEEEEQSPLKKNSDHPSMADLDRPEMQVDSDSEDEANAPLGAKDPALLERLLKQQESSAFRDMIHGEMEKRFGKGAGPYAESMGAFNRDPRANEHEEKIQADDVVQQPHPHMASTSNKIEEIREEPVERGASAPASNVVKSATKPTPADVTRAFTSGSAPDLNPRPGTRHEADSDDEYGDELQISGPGAGPDDEYDPIDAEDVQTHQNQDQEQPPKQKQQRSTSAAATSLPDMLASQNDDDDDEGDERNPENFPALADDAEGDDGMDEEERAEVISNLMESWKAQGAQPGPVGLMFGGGGATKRK